MANYLVASGSRKISQLEIATNPVPAGSSSVMPLVIGDAIPITNGTTVQITPDNFLSNLVFDASENYTGNNAFTGSNTFSGSLNVAESSFNATNTISSVPYITTVQGGSITFLDTDTLETLRVRNNDGDGFKFENYNPILDSSVPFLTVESGVGNVQIHRETHFSNDVYITGSLRVQEVFYVFETASILNSSGSTNFGDTGDDTHKFSGSILLSGSLAIIDGATLDGVDLSVFSSSVQAESQSFAQRDTDLEFFSSSQYNSESSSFSTRTTDLEFFSSSQYQTDSASFSADITENSQSLSLLSGSYENFSGSQYITDSGSFSTRVTTNETDIGNLQTDSGSFSTRVTTNETDILNLQTDSGSFSTRVTAQENFSSSQYNAESSSFSADITENSQSLSLLSASFETTSSKLIDASGSFSTRVTDLELFSSSQYQTDSGSFSTRVTNNELTGSDHEDRIVKGTNAVTSSAVSSSYIDLDVLANGDIPAHKAGRIFFGSEDGALEVYNEEADFTLQVGQEFVVRAYNKSGGVIGNGTPVYASGSQGDRIGIYPATAEDHTSGVHYENHIIGIATHEIGISSEGYVTAQGIVRGIDTQNFTAGDTLYLQTGSPATPEDYYRNTPPPFPYDIVQVGYVSRVAANGFVFVQPKEPVHFSNISGLSGSFTPEVGDLWVYQENGSWTPTHNLTGSYTIGGDLLPETTEVHDLGSPTQRWRDLYLSGSTIDLGGLLIQRTVDGNVQFIDSASQEVKTVGLQSANSNITIGDTAGSQLTSGTDNTLIGNSAGANIASDSIGNTGLGSDIWGYSSASPKDVGNYNTAIGYFSQERKEEGIENTSVGSYTLRFNYSGSGNTAVGSNALNSIANSSHYNTAIGHRAGTGLVSGRNNIFIGSGARGGSTNSYNNMIVIGSGSVGNTSNTTTIGNDEITHTYIRGLITGSSIETGDVLVTSEVSSSTINVSDSVYVTNSITASRLLIKDSIGTDNLAIGEDANENIAVGANYNVSIGTNAGFLNTTGERNTAIGWQSMGFGGSTPNLTADDNTAVGYRSLGSIQSTGTDNVAIGASAGFDITTGTDNTIIGFNADVASATDSSCIVIGSGVTGGGSNTVTIGKTGNRDYLLTGDLIKLRYTTAGGTPTLKLHSDTDTSPKAAIEFQRGANDTWGADAYRDFRMINDGGEFTLEYGESGTTQPAFTYDTSGRWNFQTSSYDITTKGVTIDASARVLITTEDSVEPLLLNRHDSDGVLIEFRQANAVEGDISVSGATVTLNGFAGAHESSGISTDSPIGTVVSTIDELDTREIDGVTQTINNHPKIKVSDVVGDSRIYGVVGNYNPKTGKPQITAVGIGSVLVTGPCNGGDLLESNGDGTAKVQGDDIIRSKTIGKVTVGDSNSGVKLVSCVLYCG